MSYPQPDSNQYVVGGFNFFRLFTGLTSPGDLYESEQGGHGFVIGPDSDVANVNVVYFDGQVPTFVNQVGIGQQRAFVGQLSARNDVQYAPSNRPGRILIYPADLFDPAFIPNTFNSNTDTLTFFTPILDVVEYFQPQPSLDVLRNDKTYRLQELAIPSRFAYTVIPFWGRKYASARITNLTGNDVEWIIEGINYYINDQFSAIQTPIDTQILPSGTQHESLVKASVNGVFDALLLTTSAATPDGPTPIQLTVSDKLA